MGTLSRAFDKTETQEDPGFLRKLFSSPLVRGFYKDEKPEIPVALEGTETEKKRLASLVNMIAKNSPTGRKLLETMTQEGYSLGFEFQMDSKGYCSAEEKVIRLNPVMSDATLATTLSHEARHVQQNQTIPSAFCTFDVASELKLRRATEADAQAAAVQVALEIRAATQSGKVWNSFSRGNPDIARNVKTPSVFKSVDSVVADRDATMRDAFKGWFSDWKIVDAYEQGYLYAHLMRAGELRDNPEEQKAYFAEKPFNGHLSSAQVLQMVCANGKEKGYFENDPDLMDNDTKMCGICKQTRTAADMFFREREKLTGQAPDTSYQDLPDRGTLFKAMECGYRGMSMSLKTTAEKKPLSPVALKMAARMRGGR